ncbi:MAG: hypothetical protein E6F99_18865 [Actinobacteria bacterium]|nr:MAG: hypothetical protein E6F99_18865 [Actinomycetota bacterium]
MNKRLTALLAGLGALVLAATGAAVGMLTPAQAAPAGSTLTLDVNFAPFFLLDFGPDGVHEVTSFQQPFDPSRGDQVMFRDELLRHGRVVGHDGGACTVTEFVPADADKIKLTCQVTFELPEGVITTQGVATENPAKHLVITAGTGRYLGAQGDVLLTEFPDNTGSVVFHFARPHS